VPDFSWNEKLFFQQLFDCHGGQSIWDSECKFHTFIVAESQNFGNRQCRIRLAAEGFKRLFNIPFFLKITKNQTGNRVLSCLHLNKVIK